MFGTSGIKMPPECVSCDHFQISYSHSIGKQTQKSFLSTKTKFSCFYPVWFYRCVRCQCVCVCVCVCKRPRPLLNVVWVIWCQAIRLQTCTKPWLLVIRSLRTDVNTRSEEGLRVTPSKEETIIWYVSFDTKTKSVDFIKHSWTLTVENVFIHSFLLIHDAPIMCPLPSHNTGW